MREIVNSHVTMMKIVPNVTQAYRELWGIPKEHNSVGFIASDCEDVMYIALDDASKKANIKIIHAETVFGGVEWAWSKFGGEIIGIISGPKVSDVRSGLMYAKDFIENKAKIYFFDKEHTLGAYVDLIPKAGKYYQKTIGAGENEAVAYLVSTPIECTYGLDRALKASNTRIGELFTTPSRVNTGGAVVIGTESACRAAVESFLDAVEYCVMHPMDIDL